MSVTAALATTALTILAVIGAWRVLDLLLDAHLRGVERLRRASRRTRSAR
jgi:hypothetical protein